ncbi:MAG: hypothetical protein Q8920_10370 [Bacillota bacterium]|nr:hypothetical protein [Bacillota bacterium]
MSKCVNCNREDAAIKFSVLTWRGSSKENVEFTCCSEECKKEVEDFTAYVNKNVAKFIILIILGSLSFIPFIILYSSTKKDLYGILSLFSTLFIIGFAIFKYPFATPQTNSSFGFRKAVKITKAIGLCLMALGIAVMALFSILG